MESLSSAQQTITVHELLHRRSPLSVHHHLSSSKRRRLPGAEDEDELHSKMQRGSIPHQSVASSTAPASETLASQHFAGNGLLCAALQTLAQEKNKERDSSTVLHKSLALEISTDQYEAARVLPHHNVACRTPALESCNDAGRVSSIRNTKPHMLCSKSLTPRSQAALLCLSEEPFLLLGWIQLWNSSPHEADCLAFSDSSGTLCCVIRDFDPQLLGHPVRLLSWSYIPGREKGGCLEIRQIEPVQISNSLPSKSVYLSPEMANVPNLVLETPPSKQNIKSQRLAIAGCVSFISPPFAIPHGESRSRQAMCKEAPLKMMVSNDIDHKLPLYLKEAQISMQNVAAAQSNHAKFQDVAAAMTLNKPLLGFFLGLSACKHKPSCLNPRLDRCHIVCFAGYGDCEAAKQHVSYIYFSGSTAAWRPILLAMSGKCISLTGLRKKVLVAGENRTQYRIYAATRTSSVARCTSSPMNRVQTRDGDHIVKTNALHLVKEQKRQICQHKQVGSYVGIVTEIFLRGGLLELDGCVWLLLTHQPLSQVHGLRIGATVTAYHVHFLRVTSLYEQALLLAACSISHLVVTHFSPLQIVYAGKRDSQSCLSRFIASLPFLSAFWALQVIASFKQKFRGFYNEKEILGSVKSIGIAEAYLRKSSSFSNAHRRNVFEEFFSHTTSCSLAELAPCHFFLQVPPIGNFCKQIQIMWLDQISCIWNMQHKTVKREDHVHELRENRETFFRRVISSDLLGLTALGFLQFSSVLGKLQLVDATGAIDVIIPDLETTQCFQGACQVTTYKLVIEGYLEPSSVVNLNLRSFPLSWYSVLKGASFSMEASNQFYFFLIFSIKAAHFVQYIRHCNFAAQPSRKGEVQLISPFLKADKQNTGSLDMIFVLHKYPINFKSFSKETGNCSLSFCVEAVKLPYRICIISKSRRISGSEESAVVLDSSISCTVSVSCLSNVCDILTKAVVSNGEYQGYTNYPSLLQRSTLASSSKMHRLLFQFNDTYTEAFEVINIGRCYLVQSLPDPSVTTVYGGSPFWSLVADYNCGTEVESDGMQKVMLNNGSSLPFVDVVLKLPLTFETEFSSCLKDARAYLSPVLSVEEVLDHGKLSKNGELLKHIGLLEGSLLSCCGKVESFDLKQTLRLPKVPYVSAKDSKRCGPIFLSLKDLNDSQSIMVSCNPDQHGLPVGFGLGAVVAMHRALLQLSANGDVSIKCIPSTLIVVLRIGEDSSTTKNDFISLHKDELWDHNRCNNMEQQLITIGAISLYSCTNFSVPKSLKVRCRVVSVERLLIERNKVLDQCVMSSEDAIYKVQHVSLTLDDGSGLAICWAQDQAAASLLNIPLRYGQQSGRNWDTFESKHVIRQLNAIVRKYETILFHAINQEQDLSSASFVVQGAEDRALSFVEKKFIYGIVQQACHTSLLDVVVEQWLPENSMNQQWEGQKKKMQNEKAPLPRLLASKVDAVCYERHLIAITKDLENTLQNYEDSVT